MTENERERETIAWLETLVAENGDTIEQHPDRTIVPPPRGPDTAGRRALELLRRLADSTATAAVPPLLLGDTIGQGGMGVVRAGEQVALGRQVAIKCLRPDKHSDSATMDLLREAWITGALEHPNVVPVYDIRLDERAQPLVVLKRIEGVHWGELMHDAAAVQERFGAGDILEWNLGILMQVLNALRYAHSRGILHRDLKPENVMIGEFGEVYVLDWGIAVALRDDESGRLPLARNATEVAGTPCYMAPEMLNAEGAELSERTDIYLAGSILYEILTGHPPHRGATALDVVSSITSGCPALPDSVPEELARICRRAMDRDPAARFETTQALRVELQVYLQRRGSALLSDRAEQRLHALLAALSEPSGAEPEERQALYRLFGECRFGFREALAAWADNRGAREGLRRSVCAMVEYELAQKDPRAADTLLAELDDPDPDLRTKIRAALEEQHEARRQREELARLGRQLDVKVGTRTRSFFSVVLGAVFTVLPLVGAVWDRAAIHSPTQMAQLSAGFLVAVLALGFWARDSMTKTLINRRVFATVVFLFIAQIALMLGAGVAEVDPVDLQVLLLFFWFCIAGMAALAIDLRLVPCAVGYLIGFGVAAARPEYTLYAMSASNLLLTINAVTIWRPSSWGYTDEERLALGKPPKKRS